MQEHDPKTLPMASPGMGAAWRAVCKCGWHGPMRYVSSGNAHLSADNDAKDHGIKHGTVAPSWYDEYIAPAYNIRCATEPEWPTPA